MEFGYEEIYSDPGKPFGFPDPPCIFIRMLFFFFPPKIINFLGELEGNNSYLAVYCQKIIKSYL